MNRRPNGYLRNKNNIIKDYRKRIEMGKALNPHAVDKDDSGLYGAIIREFSSFNDFLILLDLDPDEIRKHKVWNLDKIKKELNVIYRNNLKVDYKKNTLHNKLILAICSRFGNIDKGLKHMNFTRDKNGHLFKLCPCCKEKIVKKYDNQSEFCLVCRNKKIKFKKGL